MTENDWLTAMAPKQMLDYLAGRGKVSPRKLRLLLCACCRQLWPLFRDDITRQALEMAERHADGLAPKGQLQGIRQAVLLLLQEEMGWKEEDDVEFLMDHHERSPFEEDLLFVTRTTAVRATGNLLPPRQVSRTLNLLADTQPSSRKNKARAACKFQQTALVRDIFGNPFRPLSATDPSLLRWQGSTIPKLAQAVYDDRHLPAGTLDPARLAVLADALEEAGVTDPDLLDHRRGPDFHVRGCYVLDALLGKS
jgi:hypothetical protein